MILFDNRFNHRLDRFGHFHEAEIGRVDTVDGAFVGMFFFLSGVRSYARDGLYADAWRIREVATLAVSACRALIFPILAFWGLCLLAFPLYGFAFFIGFLSLLAYSSALFREMEKDS